MQNRTAAIIITIVVVLLCLCPGLGALCLGLSSLADFITGSGFFASDQDTYIGLISAGLCSGIVLIGIAVLIIFFVLRRKKELPSPFPLPLLRGARL